MSWQLVSLRHTKTNQHHVPPHVSVREWFPEGHVSVQAIRPGGPVRWAAFLGDAETPLSAKDPWMVEYQCTHCRITSRCRLHRALKRWGDTGCAHCVGGTKMASREETSFFEEDTEYQERYWYQQLTQEEFAKIRPRIQYVQGKKWSAQDIANWDFCPVHVAHAGLPYQPFLYDPVREVMERPVDLTLRCSRCGDDWSVSDLASLKHRKTLYCPSCVHSLSQSLQRAPWKTHEAEYLTYETKWMRKFLQFCRTQHWRVTHGPSLHYLWAPVTELSEERIWRIPYRLPEMGVCVTLRSVLEQTHEVRVGLWDAKMEGWECREEEYRNDRLVCLTPENYVRELQKIKNTLTTVSLPSTDHS